MVAPVKPFHPYLVDDLVPLLDLHCLRISPWFWFSRPKFGSIPALLVLFLLGTSLSMMACAGTESDGVPAASPELVQTSTAVPTATAMSSPVGTPTPAPTSNAAAKSDEPPPASPTPEATEIPSPPPNATPGLSQPEIAKAPVPSEPAPLGWRTYYNGEFGFSIDHPRYELVRDEVDRPYFRERLDENRGIWVSFHKVTGVDPLADFAHWYRDTVVERQGLGNLKSEISLTEEVVDGRRFFRETLNKNGEGFSGGYRGSFATITRLQPGFGGRFPEGSALPFHSSRAVAGFDRPVGAPRPSLGPLRPHQPVS